MNALSIFKTVTEGVVSAGTGAIVGNLIKATTPVPTTVKGIRAVRQFNRLSVVVGGLAISSFVGDLASKHAVNKIDEAVKSFNELKGAVTEQVEQIKDEN